MLVHFVGLMWTSLKMSETPIWYYKGEPFDESLIEDHEGFVYLVTNKKTGMKYVGKKLFKFSRKKKVKAKTSNKKITRRTKVDSDWKSYWGSSKNLAADIEKYGSENFEREILHLCETKGIASYLEMVEQVERKVLETDEYYNGIINVRIGGSNVLKESLKKRREEL